MKIKQKRDNHNDFIPGPAISRLCLLYGLLDEAGRQGITAISSREIGKRLGVGPHNVRKDISHIGEVGISGSGYDVAKLKAHIGNRLGFTGGKKACVAGLGSLGAALLNADNPFTREYTIVAGFDSSINKLETIKTTVPVFPSRDIPDVVSRRSIELAVITVPAPEAAETVRRLVEGGIRGIINFSSALIEVPDGVFIRNIDLAGEFRLLSALIALAGNSQIED